MDKDQTLAPVAAAERMQALDVLRGFALLGIFLMNIEFFSRPLQDIETAGIDPSLHGIHYATDALVYFFVQSKFWTLFSLLFGMGFAVMIDRAQRAGRSFLATYLRRTLALLAIGAAHALLIWSGDILISYAICALVLLLLRQMRRVRFGRRTEAVAPVLPMAAGSLIGWGAALYSLPLVLMLAAGALGSAFTAPEPTAAEKAEQAEAKAEQLAEREAATRTYSTGTYAEAVRQRGIDTRWQLNTLPFAGILIVGVFTLGAGLVRSGALARPQDFQAQYRRVRNVGLPLGFGLMAISTSLGTAPPMLHFGLPEALQMVGYLSAGLILALAYGATLVLALQGRHGAWLQAWLAPAGRMALSNYLLQSLVGTLLFFNYGLGLWGQVPRALQVLLVLAVFSLQLLLSRWWLGRFRFGPVEWLWRAVTYLQLPAMRRTPAGP